MLLFVLVCSCVLAMQLHTVAACFAYIPPQSRMTQSPRVFFEWFPVHASYVLVTSA
jgi:hypothetical protein